MGGSIAVCITDPMTPVGAPNVMFTAICMFSFLGFRDTLLFSKSHHLRLFQYLGVPRETKEEKEIADFDIFDDPESPFSTFNFQYPNQAFKRLHDLMHFNTLNNIDVSISCHR